MKSSSDHWKKLAANFLAESAEFRLGALPTESRHPLTMQLSDLCQKDLRKAIDCFRQVDLLALEAVKNVIPGVLKLHEDIFHTLEEGHQVFVSGCGATGRLAISLESIWREQCLLQRKSLSPTTHPWQERVFGFIAGGDFALVKSIENFEDHPEYGVRQLQDLGFTKNDLLIAVTEGGETPFVIGTAEYAAELSLRSPHFIFCNPPELLKKTTERSHKILENPKVRSLFINTGPMALSGSTRLQATTTQQLAVGAALLACLHSDKLSESKVFCEQLIEEFLQIYQKTDFNGLEKLIVHEASIYQRGEYCVHQTSDFGITVLTDTTERTPTFSLLPFESNLDSDPQHSWTYLSVKDTHSSEGAWKKVLHRGPRSLAWANMKDLYGESKTLGYDFSAQCLERRQNQIGANKLHSFEIEKTSVRSGQPASSHIGFLRFSIAGQDWQTNLPGHLLHQHLLTKCALNITCTLVMGRLHRFYGNVMVYVRPTNKKLVDRSIRYIQLLLQEKAISTFSYEDICYALFQEFSMAAQNVPIVLRTLEHLVGKSKLAENGGVNARGS